MSETKSNVTNEMMITSTSSIYSTLSSTIWKISTFSWRGSNIDLEVEDNTISTFSWRGSNKDLEVEDNKNQESDNVPSSSPENDTTDIDVSCNLDTQNERMTLKCVTKVPSIAFVLFRSFSGQSMIQLEEKPDTVSMREYALQFYQAFSSINFDISATTRAARTNTIGSMSSSMTKAITVIRSLKPWAALRPSKPARTEGETELMEVDQVFSNRSARSISLGSGIMRITEKDFPELSPLYPDTMSITSILRKNQNEYNDNCDVLVEKGDRANNNPGNKEYLGFIDQYRDEYRKAKPKEKKKISKRVVLWVKKRGGRFLKREKVGKVNKWYEIDDKQARKKAVKALGAKKRISPLKRKITL